MKAREETTGLMFERTVQIGVKSDNLNTTRNISWINGAGRRSSELQKQPITDARRRAYNVHRNPNKQLDICVKSNQTDSPHKYLLSPQLQTKRI